MSVVTGRPGRGHCDRASCPVWPIRIDRRFDRRLACLTSSLSAQQGGGDRTRVATG